ncbi:MAG: peptidoglycan editing factor PgeF [Agathobaculum sp.]|jgi:YfiH family protein|uniref:peptidoglycan editing factor PgeF n=1 Tax=Agathobaculum sp. TaxID=2048138 RepID=UPI003D8ABF82
MHQSMCRVQSGPFVYYTCRRLPVRHAFTTKFGGVSTGHCAELNLGFSRGDEPENVRENYRRLAEELGVPAARMTLTRQIHDTQISVVTENEAGMGLTRPMAWQSDAIVTALPDTPLIGFYADCVVTLLYDPATHTAGVCHAGWRGMVAGILPKTVDVMAEKLGARRESLIAVLGPSIRQECFETDADVPEAMERQLGAPVRPFIAEKGAKFHVDLQGIGAALLRDAGLAAENVIDSGICTMCAREEFWSHRATNGVRGVQGGVICL